MKAYALQVNWYHYLPAESLFVFSSEAHGATMHVLQIERGVQSGNIVRWPKFDVDCGAAGAMFAGGGVAESMTPPPLPARRGKLLPQHVSLCRVYVSFLFNARV